METLTNDLTSTPSTFAERAAALQERGFSLIPLAPRGKQPVAGLGVRSRTKDPERIAQWAEQFPDANVGVCADDTFIILDADNAEEMLKVTGQLNTYTVESSPGKAHYYFRRDPQGFNYVRNLELGKLGSLRAENMYVVGEGSIHPKTGEPYRVINDAPVAVIHPRVYHELEMEAARAEREIERITVDWDGASKIPEGSRQFFLRSHAGKLWDGEKDEEQLFAELWDLNIKFCEPTKPEGEIRRLVEWVMTKEPNRPGGEVIFGGPRVKRQGYVLEPIGKWDRWFALGQVGQIYGASGAGKSTFALQMLEAVAQGADFLGHRTQPRSILIVPLDRNGEALHETLDRMRIPRDLFPWAALPEDVLMDSRLAAPEVNKLLEVHGRPEILLLEGMDTLCLDQTQKGIVPFIRSFQRIAEHHGTAIIGTWGSPKRMSAPREQYKGLRDAASGSGMLGRMCTTMVYVREDYETGSRTVECGHRQCAHERFEMRFKEDRLALFAASDIPEAEPTEPMDVLISRFTWDQLKDKGLMSKATYYRRKAELEPKSRLSQVELPGEDLPELVS